MLSMRKKKKKTKILHSSSVETHRPTDQRVEFVYIHKRRRGGLMVSGLVPGSSGPGLIPGRGHCVVFLGKTLYSHSTSLHPGVQMGTGELNAGGKPAMD